MMHLARLHHAAIICSDYARSKDFYTRILGLRVITENLRVERQSYKLDLALADGSQHDHVQHHWIQDAVHFKSESTNVATGLLGIPMRSIALRAGSDNEKTSST